MNVLNKILGHNSFLFGRAKYISTTVPAQDIKLAFHVSLKLMAHIPTFVLGLRRKNHIYLK